MKFWKPPHEHEELLEEQIESIIQEVKERAMVFGEQVQRQEKGLGITIK